MERWEVWRGEVYTGARRRFAYGAKTSASLSRRESASTFANRASENTAVACQSFADCWLALVPRVRFDSGRTRRGHRTRAAPSVAPSYFDSRRRWVSAGHGMRRKPMTVGLNSAEKRCICFHRVRVLCYMPSATCACLGGKPPAFSKTSVVVY